MPSPTGEFDRYVELLRPLQRSLEVYCCRALSNSSFVEDVLQSVVAKTVADFESFVEGTNFRAWIFRYLHYEVLACNRRESNSAAGESTRVEDVPHVPSWEQLVAERSFDRLLAESEDILDQCDDLVAEAVRQLPENEQAVLLLRAIGEFKHAEIAEVLSIPIGTVMSHLSRGRATLRYRLLEFARERGHFRRGGEESVDDGDAVPDPSQGDNP